MAPELQENLAIPAHPAPRKVADACTARYAGWELDFHRQIVTRSSRDPSKKKVKLPLIAPTRGGLYEAWFPYPTLLKPKVVHGACCLLDGRWQIEFPARKKRESVVRRRLSLKHDRADAFERIRNGRKPELIYFPIAPSTYHKTLIPWEVEKFKQWPGAEIIFHIPTREYHIYISQLEAELGLLCPEMHDLLDDFSEKVRGILERHCALAGLHVTFLDPMYEWGATTPLESFQAPFMRVGEFCEDPAEFIAVGDFQEMRFSEEAAREMGITIPFLGSFLGVPHPFYNRTLTPGEYRIIQLPSY